MRQFRITVDGTAYDVTVEEIDSGAGPPVMPASRPAPTATPTAVPPRAAVTAATAALPVASGDITSPLAATVVRIDVGVGQQVSAGQQLAVLEAMKMDNFITAPQDGVVTAIHVATGDVVAEGQPLLALG